MYYIDDSNTTIQYSDAKSIPWNHKVPGIANNSADVTKCYDQTYTVNQNPCLQADSCHFQLSFIGSGITLFVIQSSNPLNTTLTLDGNMSTIATLVALPGPNDFAYNVTLYNVQELPTGSHTLDVALLGYIPSSGPDVGSMIRFDYALINNTASSVVSPSASGAGSMTATPSSGSGSTSSSHSVIGPAVGGAVGGVIVITVIIFLLLFRRRQTSSQQHVAVFDPDPSIKSFPARPVSFDPQAALYSSHLPSTSQSVQPIAYATSSRSSFPTTDINDRRSLQASSSGAPTSSTGSALIPRGSALRPSTAPSVEQHRFMVSNPETGTMSDVPMTYTKGRSKTLETQSTGSLPPAAVVAASLPPNIPGSGELTEEQASFVNNLRSLNVPAPEIASLLDVMRRERAESSAGGGGRGRRGGASTSNPVVDVGAPPSYDFKGPN